MDFDYKYENFCNECCMVYYQFMSFLSLYFIRTTMITSHSQNLNAQRD